MNLRQFNALAVVIVIVLVAVSWYLFWPADEKITQGLDIQGGLSVILTAQETTATPVTDAVMDRAEFIVRNRVDRLGAAEASIQRQGASSILVQLPGIGNAEEALAVLGATGQLEIRDVPSVDATGAPVLGEVLLRGDVITGASISTDQFGNYSVDVSFSPEGTQSWAEITTARVGRQIAIVLDGVVQSAPVVQEPILGGQTSITGDFTVEEATQLRTVLETGALPVTLEFSEARAVGPTLGQESLDRGLYAILAGLAMVSIYLLAFYRLLGVLSLLSLFVFASIFLAVLAVLSTLGWFALSLPGIAGVVLTIGLAADSSILMNERFKEEVASGKTIRSAAKSSTRHAIGTSVDADLVTMVSALALYLVAIGPVRGFALTLMIGILCDLIGMFLLKRPLIMILAENVMAKAPRWFALPKGSTNA